MTAIPVLSDAEIQSLKDTLDDEYKSYETYAQVIRDFGEVRPFVNIVEAEERHSLALLALFQKYGIAPPANRWVGKAPCFASVDEACAAAIQGEIENVELYDRALMSTDRPDCLPSTNRCDRLLRIGTFPLSAAAPRAAAGRAAEAAVDRAALPLARKRLVAQRAFDLDLDMFMAELQIRFGWWLRWPRCA